MADDAGPLRTRRIAENRIREAQREGQFDDLPGAGRPLPDLDGQYDPMWWVKKKVRREQLAERSPAREVESAVSAGLTEAMGMRTEEAVREWVEMINRKIRHANATHVRGPAPRVAPLDPEEVVRQWRTHQGRETE